MKIKIYIQPSASRNEIVGLHGDALKIKIKAPPVDGEANDELISFLSKFLKTAKKNIQILHGLTGRNKLIEILIENNNQQREIEILNQLGLKSTNS